MRKLLKKLLVLLLAISMIGCGIANDVKANEFTERFATPAMEDKPLTRWWVPGSKMDKSEIREEIESMVEAGFGGAEIVPVSLEGGDGEGEIDWGSDDWKEITKYILEVAGEYDFTIDFTMTPAWPLALPTIEDVNDEEQGAQMELDGAWVDGITKDNPFNGELPVSNEAIEDIENVDGELVLIGVTVAKYVDKENNILSYDSAEKLDISNIEKNEEGNYVLSFTPEDDGEYVLYAWYQHPSGNQKYGNNQIDHYSIYGTQMIIDYWENELIPYYGDAFENCRSLFIDSLEFETHLDWTYGLDEVFEETYDYDIVTYLAAVYDSSDDVTAIGNYMGDPVSTFTYDKNTDEIQNDYKETLTNLYIENHIKPLQEFCEKYNVTLRYQTSYGKNLEVSNTALYPDIPETETLYGNDYTDFYRLQSGAVHASDKTIYSIESAAEWTETWNEKNEDGEYGTRGNGNSNSGNYEQTFLDHIWHDQRAYASGVNQVVFHGYAYSGVYQDEALDDVSWPGFTGFESYKWSNSWGERQPNWEYASTYTNYLSRIQYTLRQGTANIDLAIYHHSYYETIDFYNPDTIFDTDVLEQNGYSYDFISPSTMELDNMKVKNGILDSDGTQYKALIFNDETDLPEETIEKIVEYAENGLVIIFIGNIPNNEKIKSLLELENVLQINDIDEIANTLKSNNIIADASYDNQTLLTTHRSDNNTEYYYLYNYGGVDSYSEMSDVENVVTSVTLQGEGDPYLANAWTGEIVKITDYTENNGSVTVEVDIAANDSNIIILSEEDISNASENTSSIDYEITLDNWTLTVESWTKGDTVLDTDKTEINIGELDELTTWDNIEGLENVSGIGTYTTSFNIEDYNENESIYIHLGKINDAYGVTINGTEVIVDQASGSCEISKYLKQGNNTIEITVATSLLNAILYENRNVLNDDGRILDDRNTSSYGLTTDVIINGTK